MVGITANYENKVARFSSKEIKLINHNSIKLRL